jgi:hypothetical protein
VSVMPPTAAAASLSCGIHSIFSSPSDWCTGVPYWGEKICQIKSEGIRLIPLSVRVGEIKKPVKAALLVPIAGYVVNPIGLRR